VPVTQPSKDAELAAWNLVGPVCESGDFLGFDRRLRLEEGSLLAVCSAGAYGMVQASNYNSRTRAAEVLVDDGNHHAIRNRETLNDLLSPERAALAARET
jgi:diaminopimelate decarboxylase